MAAESHQAQSQPDNAINPMVLHTGNHMWPNAQNMHTESTWTTHAVSKKTQKYA